MWFEVSVATRYNPCAYVVVFEATGATAVIIEITEDNDNLHEGYVQLYVGDGTLDNTPSADGFTHMSLQMLKRSAEVIK